MLTMPRARNITLVAVGDKSSKKTELLLKYTCGKRLGTSCEPSIFVNNVQDIIVDHVPYTVFFVDVESEDDYKILRLNAYEKADCFLMCYSIANRQSFENISKKWCIEIRKSCPKIPLVLVGTETEARSRESSNLISIEEGEDLKCLIGAAAFVECSISAFVGVDDVFIEAVRSLHSY